MKKVFLVLCLTLMLPFVSFSQYHYGIPVYGGAQGPTVYVQRSDIPSGTWEDVVLEGTITSANRNSLIIKSSEGFLHTVYCTNQTTLEGNLYFGSSVGIEGRLVKGALYAASIRAIAAAPAATSYSSAPQANAYSAPQPYGYPPPAYYPQSYVYSTYAYPAYVSPYDAYPYYPSIFIYGRFGWGWRGGWGRGCRWR